MCTTSINNNIYNNILHNNIDRIICNHIIIYFFNNRKLKIKI